MESKIQHPTSKVTLKDAPACDRAKQTRLLMVCSVSKAQQTSTIGLVDSVFSQNHVCAHFSQCTWHHDFEKCTQTLVAPLYRVITTFSSLPHLLDYCNQLMLSPCNWSAADKSMPFAHVTQSHSVVTDYLQDYLDKPHTQRLGSEFILCSLKNSGEFTYNQYRYIFAEIVKSPVLHWELGRAIRPSL